MEWKGIWNYVGNFIPGASRSQENVDEEDVFEDVFEEEGREAEEEGGGGGGEGIQKKPEEDMAEKYLQEQGEKTEEKLRKQTDMNSDLNNMIPENEGEVRKEISEEGEEDDTSGSDEDEEEEEEDDSSEGEEEEEESEEEDREGDKEGDRDGDGVSSSSGSSDYEDSEDVDTEIENNTTASESNDRATKTSDSEGDTQREKRSCDTDTEPENLKDLVENETKNDDKNLQDVKDESGGEVGVGGESETKEKQKEDQSAIEMAEEELVESDEVDGEIEENDEIDSEELGDNLRKILKKEKATDEEEETETEENRSTIEDEDAIIKDSDSLNQPKDGNANPPISIQKDKSMERVEAEKNVEADRKDEKKERPEGDEEIEEKDDELNETIKASEEEIVDLINLDDGAKDEIYLEDETVTMKDSEGIEDEEIKSITDGNEVSLTDGDWHENGKGDGLRDDGIKSNAKNEAEIKVEHDQIIERESEGETNIDKNEIKSPLIETKRERESDEDVKTEEKENENKEQKTRKKGTEKRKSYFEGEEFERRSALATMMDKGILEMEILTHPTSSLQFSDIAKKILKEVQDSRSERDYRNPKPKPRIIHQTTALKGKGKELIDGNMKSFESSFDQNATESFSKDTIDFEPKSKAEESSDSMPSLKKDIDVMMCSEKEFCDTLHTSKLIRTSSRLSEEDINRILSHRSPPSVKQDESVKAQEKTPDVLHSCIKVFNPIKTNVPVTRVEDINTSDNLNKSRSRKHSVTFKTDDESISESSKSIVKSSQGDPQRPDIMPLTPSPSVSECSFPSISPTDQSPTSVSLTEVSSTLPSPSGISSLSTPTHRAPPPLKPIDNSLSSSSPPLISSSSGSISDFSPPHGTPPPLPTPPDTTPPPSTPPDTSSSSLNASPESSSSLPTPPETSSSLPTPPETTPPLPIPPGNSPVSPLPPETLPPPSPFTESSRLSPLLENSSSPEESSTSPTRKSSLKIISSPPTSPLKTFSPISSPTKIPRSISSPSSPSEKFQPPISPLQKSLLPPLSPPSSLALPLVAKEQGGGSIKPSTVVAGEPLEPDTSDPKRLGVEGERTYQCSADTGRERVLHERSVDPTACTCGGKQTSSKEVRCAEDRNGNLTGISNSENRNTDGDDGVISDDGNIITKHTNECIYRNVVEKFSDGNYLLVASEASSYPLSNVTGVTETNSDVIKGDDVTRDVIGGSQPPSEPIRTLLNTDVASSLEVLENEANENRETGNNGDEGKGKRTIENSSDVNKIKDSNENRICNKSSYEEDNDSENLEGPWSSPQLAKVVQELVVSKKFKMTTAQAKKRQHNISRLDIPTKDRTVVFDSTKLSSKGKLEKTDGIPEVDTLETKKSNESQEDILKGVTRKLKSSSSRSRKLLSPDNTNFEADVSMSEASSSSQLQAKEGTTTTATEGHRLYTKNPRTEGRKIHGHKGKFFGRGHSDSSKNETSRVKGKSKEESKLLPSPKIEQLCHSPQFRKGKISTGPKRDASSSQPSPRQSPMRLRHQPSPKGSPQSESPRLNSSRKNSPKLGSKASSRSGSPKSSSPKSGSPRMSSPRIPSKRESPKSSKKSPSPRITSARIVKPVASQGKISSHRSPKSSPSLSQKRTENLYKQKTGKQDGKKSKPNNGDSGRSNVSSTKDAEDTKIKDPDLQKDEVKTEETVESDGNGNSCNLNENKDGSKEHINSEIRIEPGKVEGEESVLNCDEAIEFREKDFTNASDDIENVNEKENLSQKVNTDKKENSEKVDDSKNNNDRSLQKTEVVSEPTTPTKPFRALRREISDCRQRLDTFIDNRTVQDHRQQRFVYIASKMSGKLDAEIIQFFENQQQKPREILRNEKLIQEHFKGNPKAEKGNKLIGNSSEKAEAMATASDDRVTVENQESDEEDADVDVKRNMSTKIYPLATETKEETMQGDGEEISGQEIEDSDEKESKYESTTSDKLAENEKSINDMSETETKPSKLEVELVCSTEESLDINEENSLLSQHEERSNQEKPEDLTEGGNLIPGECNLRKEVDSDTANYGGNETQCQETCDAKVKIKEKKEIIDKEGKKEITCQDPDKSKIVDNLKDSREAANEREGKENDDIKLDKNEPKVSVTRRDELIARFKRDDGMMIEKIRCIKGSRNERPLEVKYSDSAHDEPIATNEQDGIASSTKDVKKEENILDELEKVSLIDALINDALIEEDLRDLEIEESTHCATETQTEVRGNLYNTEVLDIKIQGSTSKSEIERKGKVSEKMVKTSKGITCDAVGNVDISGSYEDDEEGVKNKQITITDNSTEGDISSSMLEVMELDQTISPGYILSEKVNEKAEESCGKDTDQNVSDVAVRTEVITGRDVENSQGENEMSQKTKKDQSDRVAVITDADENISNRDVHTVHYTLLNAKDISKSKESVKKDEAEKGIHRVVSTTHLEQSKLEESQQAASSLSLKTTGEHQVKTKEDESSSIAPEAKKEATKVEISFAEFRFSGTHAEQFTSNVYSNAKQDPEVTYANILPKASRLTSSGSEIKIENVRFGGEPDRKRSPTQKENRVTRRLMPSHRRLTKTISEGNFRLVVEPATDVDDGSTPKLSHPPSFQRSQTESEFHKDKLEAAASDVSKTSSVSEIFARGVSGKIRAKSRSVENIRLSSLSCVEIPNPIDTPPISKSNSSCRIVGVLKKKDSRENVLDLMSPSFSKDSDSDSADNKSPAKKDTVKSHVAILPANKSPNSDNQKAQRRLSKQNSLVKTATEQIESTLMEQAQPLESIIKESIKAIEVQQGKLLAAGSSATESHIYENVPEVYKAGIIDTSSHVDIEQSMASILDEKPKNLVAKVVHIYENLPAPGQLLDPPPGKLKEIPSTKTTDSAVLGTTAATGGILKTQHIQDHSILRKENSFPESISHSERTDTKEPSRSPTISVKPPRISSEPASPKRSAFEKSSLKRRQQPESESRIEKQKSNYMKQRSVRVGILKKQKSDITGVRLQKLHYFDTEFPGERRRSYSIGSETRKGPKSAKQEVSEEHISDSFEPSQGPETPKLDVNELERRCHSSISTSSNSSRSSAIDRILQSCAPCISSNTGSTLDLTVKSAVHPLSGESDTDPSNKGQLSEDTIFNENDSVKNQSVMSHHPSSKSAFRTSSSSSDVGVSWSSEPNSEIPTVTQVPQSEQDLTVKSGHSDVIVALEKDKTPGKESDANQNLNTMETSQAADENVVVASSEESSVADDFASTDNKEKTSLYVSCERDGSTPTLQQVQSGDTDFYSELLDTILSVVDSQDPANASDARALGSKSDAAGITNTLVPSPKDLNVSKESQDSVKSKTSPGSILIEQQQSEMQEKQEPVSPKKEEPERRSGTSDSDSTASVDSELAEVRRRITERFPPAPREGSQASQESVLASPSAVCPMPNCTACRSQSINSSQLLVFNFDQPESPTCCEPARAASLSFVDQACEETSHEIFVRSTSLPHDPEVYQDAEPVCHNDHEDDDYLSATSGDTERHTPQPLPLPSNYSTQVEVKLQESSSSQTTCEQASLEDKSSQSSPEQENSLKTPVDKSPQDDVPSESNNEEFKDHSESSSNQLAEEMSQLRLENEKLSARNRSLQREVEELRRVKESMVEEDLQLKPQINQMTMELTHAKEALSALKADRKRLKAEKFDLLNQMKQLYATLEDKEKELRDFIRNYEQRMKESDESLRHLAAERDETEREKWNILKHARDESEKVVKLSAQLGMKEAAIKRLQDDLEMDGSMPVQSKISPKLDVRENVLQGLSKSPLPTPEVRKQLTSVGYYSDAESVRTNGLPTPTASTPTCSPQPISTPTPTPNGRGSSADSGVRLSSDRDSTASHDGGVGTPKESPSLSPLYATPSCMKGDDRGGENTPTGGPTPSGTSLNSSAMSGLASSNASSGGLSRSAEQLCERLAEAGEASKVRGTNTLSRKSNKSGGTWGSISRVFARQKKRAALDASLYDGNGSDKRASWSPSSSLCVSPLTEESYSEKLRLLEEAQHIPLERWKAPTVLAWLEVTLGMPQYGAMCAENVRSGKVLLELSDSELEAGLGISHPMHRKKLRLAIEELREPRLSRFPRISALGHTWVSSEWLPDLGLPQYCDAFANNLVDGRLLEALTKKELEKHLGVHRKFHQASIIHGVHLLRIVRFDRQILAERRRQSENVDCDPIVWTNIRWVRWARSIDLAEYADNLKDSGVHGALVVLESSFTSDTMATALGIPQSKNIIRRHLATELESLVNPARQQLDEQARYAKLERRRQEKLAAGGSLGRSFSRSYGTGLEKAEKDKRRASLRGSLSRALGLRVREEINAAGNGGESSSSGGQSPAVSSRAHPHHPPQARPRSSVMPAGVYVHHETHRRVKSIGDIETITVTPV